MTEKLDPRQVVTLGRLIVGLLTMVVVGVGCSHGSWSASRRDTTNLVPEDSITLILYADGLHPYSNERETEVVECITDELADTHPTVHIIPPDIFRRVAFPDLASEEILPADRTWKNVVEDPVFQQRIAHLGLHYVIAVSSRTAELGRKVRGDIFVVPWVILGPERKESFLSATIIDLTQGHVTGRVGAGASGPGGGWLILPFPFYVPPSRPEARVCSELGEGVAKFLAGEEEESDDVRGEGSEGPADQ